MRIRHQSVVAVFMMIIVLTAASRYLQADTGTCGGASTTLPFTDVPSTNIFFCSIAEAYFSALTNGTTATAYSPSASVPREQMSAFVTRTLDQSLKRGSRRAALNQFWTTKANFMGTTFLDGVDPLRLVQSDGADLWVAGFGDNTVYRVRASDGLNLGKWTGATNAFGVLVAAGFVVVTGRTNPNGSLYYINPTVTFPGVVTKLDVILGSNPAGIAFDGEKIWTANSATGPGTGSVSMVSGPFSVTTVSTGLSQPQGILYDGVNIWVTDIGDDTLKKLNSGGGVMQTVAVGRSPQFPAFDGTNIWVPNLISDTVTVVRAVGTLTGTVLATLTGNGLNSPRSVAFDGERILVTNDGGNLSLWKASDLTQIGFTSPIGPSSIPFGACSDGLNFWITLSDSHLARFCSSTASCSASMCR